MLRFFRSIRQQLLAENKTVKYAKYAIGEFLLIVAGILVALQIQNWNEERKDRVEERTIVSRLIEDLNDDLAAFDLSMNNWRAKNDSLNRLRNNFSENKVSSPLSFLNDIMTSTHFGWTQRPPNRTTFDDIVGTGKLGIVDNREIRDHISDYYAYFTLQLERTDDRRTNYADLAYQLIPRASSLEVDSDRGLESGLSDTEITELATQVLNSPLRDLVISEYNFGSFGYGVISRAHQRAKELNQSLLEYQNQIGN